MTIASVAPLGTSEIIIFVLLIGIVALMVVLPFWFICKKAGLSPWLSLIMFIPMGAVVLPFMLAFMDWPNLKKQELN